MPNSAHSWLATVCQKRQREPDYGCLVPSSLTINFVSATGKSVYQQFDLPEYTNLSIDHLKMLVQEIENMHQIPLLKDEMDGWHDSIPSNKL